MSSRDQRLDRGRVLVDGEDLRALEGLPRRRERYALQCASGDTLEGEWTGVSLQTLLRALDPPPATTHLLVVGSQGYRTCVPLAMLDDRLLAVESDRGDDLPRLVGSDLGAPRAVKGVREVRAVSLDPGEEPTDLEYRPGTES